MATNTDDWTEPELAVLAAFRDGRECAFQVDDANTAPPEIRAAVLAELILTPPKPQPGAPLRLLVAGASITGLLDLGCGTLAPFLLRDCTFDEEPMLNDAKADFVGFVACRMPGLSASRLTCTGPVWLSRTEFSGPVNATNSLDRSLKMAQMTVNDVSLIGRIGDAEQQIAKFVQLTNGPHPKSPPKLVEELRNVLSQGTQIQEDFASNTEEIVQRGFKIYRLRRGMRFHIRRRTTI